MGKYVIFPIFKCGWVHRILNAMKRRMVYSPNLGAKNEDRLNRVFPALCSCGRNAN
jgi:hypothetical protein